ncbi:MAG: RloB family protein [Bacteroidales bacterium]|nr:RloB family protein [Bacteroidales bacterium]
MKTKNKKIEQIESRKKHKEQLKLSRKFAPNLERPIANLAEKSTKSILIVCEGEKTEPSYFNQFEIPSLTIKAVGTGHNTISLVNKAEEFASQKKYDQVWCVFDKDDFSERSFNDAIQKALSKKFKVAYSNQSFEYWLILHFNDHQGGRMHRDDYNKKINTYLKPFGVVYDGKRSKIITEHFFELLSGIDEKTGEKRIKLAIKRAKTIYDKLDHKNPAKEESSTTVFRLVKELQKYA